MQNHFLWPAGNPVGYQKLGRHGLLQNSGSLDPMHLTNRGSPPTLCCHPNSAPATACLWTHAAARMEPCVTTQPLLYTVTQPKPCIVACPPAPHCYPTRAAQSCTPLAPCWCPVTAPCCCQNSPTPLPFPRPTLPPGPGPTTVTAGPMDPVWEKPLQSGSGWGSECFTLLI